LKEYRANYNLPHLLSGGDASVWWSMKTSEVMQTAVLQGHKLSFALKESFNPNIGKIQAETKHFGTLSLDEFMVHPQSYASAFIVMHKGEVV
jgi:NRPS condensation-like uncharacterized protein